MTPFRDHQCADAQERSPVLLECDDCDDGYGEFNIAAGRVICPLCLEHLVEAQAYERSCQN